MRSIVNRYSAPTVGVLTGPYIHSEVKYGRHLAHFRINIASNSISSRSASYAFYIKYLTNGLIADTKGRAGRRTEDLSI